MISLPVICSKRLKSISAFAFIVLTLSVTVAASAANSAATVPTQTYSWKNVQMQGMGYVTGVVVQPKVPDLVYIRTDVGGCYRWDASRQSWVPLMDSFDKTAWPGGLESIAVDPSEPDVVYAAGTFGKTGDIYRSPDRGATWSPLGLRRPDGKPVTMSANSPYRGAGERLVVNPSNSASIFFGSRSDGLFHSADHGKTWVLVTSLPNAGTPKFGVTFVQFSADSKSDYAGVAGAGVFKSADEGSTWTLAQAAPSADAFPFRAASSTDGDLFVTYASLDGKVGGVYKIPTAGAAVDVTPNGSHAGYVGIAVDPRDPKKLAVCATNFSSRTLYTSADGGATWTLSPFHYTTPGWWPRYELASSGTFGYSSALALDPNHPSAAWAADGFGIFHTDDIFAQPATWSAKMKGLEELVVLALTSPTTGAPLISGSADMHGFYHASLDVVPAATLENGKFGDTDSLDFCETHPNVIVRAGGGENDGKASNGYSVDGGATWREFAGYPPNFNNGKVAISATDPNLIVWTPTSNHWAKSDPLSTVYPVRSTDGGQTWQAVEGAQPNLGAIGMWFGGTPLASDRVDGNLFYYYEQNWTSPDGISHGGRMRRSTDGGQHWEVTANLPDWYEVSVKAVPGKRGDVWVGYSDGRPLYRSVDAGVTFSPVPDLDKVWQFAFGKNKSGSSCPTLFVLGVVDGETGLFRSDDLLSLPPSNSCQAHWVRVNGTEGFGGATCMVGDRQVYGRIYVGTGGRGILYGAITQ